MTNTRQRVIFIFSIAAFIGFCLWLFYDPGFEPAIGVIASAGSLAAGFWPRGSTKYVKGRLVGSATFDYSNNNGLYVIGDGDLLFETKWSKGSDTSIHLYNDPPSIHSIAIATGVYTIKAVVDGASYDATSRTRTLQEREVAIVKNVHGNYAAIQIVDVKDRTRSDDRDELTFRYVINPGGISSFA